MKTCSLPHQQPSHSEETSGDHRFIKIRGNIRVSPLHKNHFKQKHAPHFCLLDLCHNHIFFNYFTEEFTLRLLLLWAADRVMHLIASLTDGVSDTELHEELTERFCFDALNAAGWGERVSWFRSAGTEVILCMTCLTVTFSSISDDTAGSSADASPVRVRSMWCEQSVTEVWTYSLKPQSCHHVHWCLQLSLQLILHQGQHEACYLQVTCIYLIAF